MKLYTEHRLVLCHSCAVGAMPGKKDDEVQGSSKRGRRGYGGKDDKDGSEGCGKRVRKS